MKLSQLGELGLLAELEQRGLIVGVENDAASLPGGVVVTQDALVEGVHFRLDWITWRDLGFRAAAVNLSDLAASGADPDGLLVSLALPAETELEDVLELYAGIAETGARVVGGDTTSAETVLLSVTAIGRSARIPGRAGACPGDAAGRHGPARRSGRGVRARSLRSAADPYRRGQAPRGRGARHARHLRRPGCGRRAHRRALGRLLRDRSRARAAGAGRDDRLLSASGRTTSCLPPFRTPAATRRSGGSRLERASSRSSTEFPARCRGGSTSSRSAVWAKRSRSARTRASASAATRSAGAARSSSARSRPASP